MAEDQRQYAGGNEVDASLQERTYLNYKEIALPLSLRRSIIVLV
jgi:hypothetical protein